MEGTSGGECESVNIAAMLHDSDLSQENRRIVHNVLASGMLEGWNPSRDAVALLIDAVAGNTTIHEYKAWVVADARARGRGPI